MKKCVDRKIKYHEYTCVCEGLRKVKWIKNEDKVHEARAIMQTNCEAKINLKRNKATNKYIVTKFFNTHNHTLFLPKYLGFHRGHHHINKTNASQAKIMCDVGIHVSNVVTYFAKNSGIYCVYQLFHNCITHISFDHECILCHRWI